MGALQTRMHAEFGDQTTPQFQECQMPEMIDPHGARPYIARPDSAACDGGANSQRLRVRTALHRARLTHALAEGADRDASDELALRARQLTSTRTRRTLARTLRRSVAEAHAPAMTRVMTIIDRAAVLDAEDAIAEMVERLRSPGAVQPAGMAMLERILANAERSPLYNRAEPGALRRAIRGATAALDARPSRSHEFALAV
jgi:hypothetical protein